MSIHDPKRLHQYALRSLEGEHPILNQWASLTLDERYDDPPEWQDVPAPGLRIVVTTPCQTEPITATMRLTPDNYNTGRIENWLNQVERYVADSLRGAP